MSSTLIIIRGVPGSGKSYLTNALRDSLGQDTVVTLDPDKIDKTSDAFRQYSEQLAAEGVEKKFHPFRFLRQTGYDGILAGKIVIWNQAFNDFNGFEITIKRMQEFADANNVSLRILVVEVEIDKEVAWSRIRSRAAAGGHDVPREKFEQFVNEYESFAGRGYETLVINGADSMADSVAAIRAAVNA